MRRNQAWGSNATAVTQDSVHGEGVPQWLRRAGGYSWRLLVTLAAVAVVVYGALQIKLVLIAIFLALVITSVLDPA